MAKRVGFEIAAICGRRSPQPKSRCNRDLDKYGGEGGIRIHPLFGNKGVLRCSPAFYGTEKKGTENLLPPKCPSEILHYSCYVYYEGHKILSITSHEHTVT